MTRAKTDFRPGLLMPAALFLFNPNINLFDIFPDCIGYIFLIAAIAPTCALVPHFGEARNGFRRLFWITLLKIPAYFMMTSLVGDSMDNRTLITLMTLGFAIAEAIFFFSATAEFFTGMDYLGTRFGAFSASGPVADVTKRVTYIWFAAKQLLAFLPELCHLSSYEYYGYVSSNTINIANYYYIFVIAAVLLSLIAGITYLAFMLSFSSVLCDDRALLPLLARIREDNTRPLRGEKRIRCIKTALTCFATGAFFLLNFYIDNINYLPNVIAAVFFALAALRLLSLTYRAIAPMVIALVAVPVSVTAYVLRAIFFAEYTYAALGRVRAADALYTACEIFFAIECALYIALFALFIYLLFFVVRNETGYRADNIHNYSSHLSLHGALCRKSVTLSILGILAVIANTADVFLRRITDSFAKENPLDDIGIQSIVLPVYGGFWLISLAVTTCFFLYALHYASVMTNEVSLKYSLD